jgi:hypothetical protein
MIEGKLFMLACEGVERDLKKPLLRWLYKFILIYTFNLYMCVYVQLDRCLAISNKKKNRPC